MKIESPSTRRARRRQPAGVDYTALRAEVPIRRILERIHYEPLIIRGDQWRGPCPLPDHPPATVGDCSFSVNVQRNIYNCFRCRSGGNQLDFWAELRQLPLYQAARDLYREFNLH